MNCPRHIERVEVVPDEPEEDVEDCDFDDGQDD